MADQHTTPILSRRDVLDALLAEYAALYRLAEFRMASLDRRVPAAGAALVAFTGGVPALNLHAQLILLIAIPASLIWFLRTTINHARSFEDLLRRIEQLEQAVNNTVETQAMAFQSSHPSRGTAVGGRTGAETVNAVGMACVLLLGACWYLATAVVESTSLVLAYVCYFGTVSAMLALQVSKWRRYRYLDQPTPDDDDRDNPPRCRYRSR